MVDFYRRVLPESRTKAHHPKVRMHPTHDTPGGTPRRVFSCAGAMRYRVRRTSLTGKESQAMPFQKGQSGNPAGRPRGSRNKAAIALQELLERDAESIARTVTHLAKHGN